MADTPFLLFWRALTEQSRRDRQPEPTCGPAWRAWLGEVGGRHAAEAA